MKIFLCELIENKIRETEITGNIDFFLSSLGFWTTKRFTFGKKTVRSIEGIDYPLYQQLTGPCNSRDENIYYYPKSQHYRIKQIRDQEKIKNRLKEKRIQSKPGEWRNLLKYIL